MGELWPLSSTTTTMSSDETPPPSYERDNSRSPKAHIEGHGAGKPYKPHDVITETTQAAIVSFVAASFLAGLKNSFSKQNLGVTGVLTAQAPILGLVTAAPTTYMFVRGATNNLIGREDAWGSTAGGFAAGAILGLPSKRMPIVMGLGAAVGLSQGCSPCLVTVLAPSRRRTTSLSAKRPSGGRRVSRWSRPSGRSVRGEEFAALATRSAGESTSRRSSASRSTQSAPPSTAASRHHFRSARSVHTYFPIMLLGRQEFYTKNRSFLFFCSAPCALLDFCEHEVQQSSNSCVGLKGLCSSSINC